MLHWAIYCQNWVREYQDATKGVTWTPNRLLGSALGNSVLRPPGKAKTMIPACWPTDTWMQPTTLTDSLTKHLLQNLRIRVHPLGTRTANPGSQHSRDSKDKQGFGKDDKWGHFYFHPRASRHHGHRLKIRTVPSPGSWPMESLCLMRAALHDEVFRVVYYDSSSSIGFSIKGGVLI